jgi:hypothetical protein
MKRTYIQPSVATVKVNLESMIAASELNVYRSTLNANEAESRESGGFFDDDEDF